MAFGVTLGELVDGYGGGTLSGRPVRAVQVGGPLGAYLPTADFDLPMDYEAFAAAGAMVGHGGIVVFDDTVDMAAQARFAMEFCAAESCGKCTPCRVGSVRGVEVIDRITAGEHRDENLALLEDLCDVMTEGSLCAMGGLTPMPVRSAIAHFADDFVAPRTQRGSHDRASRREDGGHAMSMLKEPDYGTPAKDGAATVAVEVDGLARRRPRGHVGHAGGRTGGHRRPQAVRHRPARGVRLLPAVSGRDRRPPRHSRLVHDPGRRRHGRAHPDAEGRQAPRERHGALHLRPSARLPDLPGQR